MEGGGGQGYVVAILGIGGLGLRTWRLAIQLSQDGFKAMVVERGKDKGKTVKTLAGCITLTATCRTQLKNCLVWGGRRGEVDGEKVDW
jgi:D-arabinose 1-dehydrogenase-like Zn-dependent alcohol dehydrogenase